MSIQTPLLSLLPYYLSLALLFGGLLLVFSSYEAAWLISSWGVYCIFNFIMSILCIPLAILLSKKKHKASAFGLLAIMLIQTVSGSYRVYLDLITPAGQLTLAILVLCAHAYLILVLTRWIWRTRKS